MKQQRRAEAISLRSRVIACRSGQCADAREAYRNGRITRFEYLDLVCDDHFLSTSQRAQRRAAANAEA